MELAGYRTNAREHDAAPAATLSLTLLTSLFGLHTFLLMGTGTWSDLAMAGEDFGTALYYVREGALASGFLLYAAFARWRKTHSQESKAADTTGISATVLFALCTLVLNVSSSPLLRVPAVLAIACLVGASGGMVYERVALAVPRLRVSPGSKLGSSGSMDVTRTLGIVVGTGGAVAFLAQYVLQNAMMLGGVLDVCFVICFGTLVWLARSVRPTIEVQEAGRSTSTTRATPLASLVVVAACLFALLSFYEPVMRATGSIGTFYEWYRLFGMTGYVAIGVIAYAGGRPAASIAVVICALFTVVVLVQTALMETGPATMILYYFLLSAALAWSAIAFMSEAARSTRPALVASTGRILVALVTLSGSLIQAAGQPPLMFVLVCSLALLAVVVVAMAKRGFLTLPEPVAPEPAPSPEPEPAAAEPAPAPTTENRIALMADEFGLTNRERDVLRALVLTEDKNQQIANNLGISRRQLQTHISHIYQKTGVETRAGLVMRANRGL